MPYAAGATWGGVLDLPFRANSGTLPEVDELTPPGRRLECRQCRPCGWPMAVCKDDNAGWRRLPAAAEAHGFNAAGKGAALPAPRRRRQPGAGLCRGSRHRLAGHHEARIPPPFSVTA